MEEKDYFAWISTIKDIQYTKLNRLLKGVNGIEELYHSSEKKLLNMTDITKKDVEAILKAKTEFDKNRFYDELEKNSIKFATIKDDEFPDKLRIFDHKPYFLFYKGSLPDNDKKSVAMIGARACSNYGRNMAKSIAKELSENGVQIISGMARGIDTYSQLGAIEGGEKTFAIVGCGVDIVYPIENIELYENIIEYGGIISEYPPGSKPLNWHFPQRNRIISGLADIVAVIEAKEKSGSLITVEWALEQGKDIYALPGRVGDALSGGCNRLLKVGAGVLTSAKDILEELHIEEKNRVSKITSQENLLEKDFSLVYIELGLQPINISELIEKTGIEYERLSEILLQLQLDGMVEQPMENYYARVVV